MTDLSNSRVLIVDDVKANVDVLVEALGDDYKLSVALSGESALKNAEKNPPDLVLLDIMMPGMDGYEVCRRLRASRRLREVPVMFLSSLEDVINKARGFEAGGNDYLTKPFEALEVQARVRSLLRAKAYADAVKEKLENELRIARDIQRGILPLDIAGPKAGTGLDIHALLEPAQQVGGDLYEVIRAGPDRVVAVIGDVSGKGIPAALFMAVTTTLVRVFAADLERPEAILARVNDALTVQNPRDLFVTLCCAVIEPRARRVTSASMGHPSPVLVSDGKPPRLPFLYAGLPAGIMAGTEIPSESLEFAPGDTLFFYTDGVTEAFNAQSYQFGEHRLRDCLARTNGMSAADMAVSVLSAVRAHAGEHPQSDDITLLAVRSTQ
jgi:sigma-B regulation protein RsbU (phosphoserine phosphatase)